MDDPSELVKQPSRFEIAEAIPVTSEGVQIQSYAQMKVWAAEIASSGMAPKGLDTEAKVMLAAQTGMELGFSLVRALQAVVIVNGRATLMGEAALALIRNSGQLEVGTEIEVGCRHTTEEEKLAKEGALVGFCRTTRRGGVRQETLFTEADARLAGLWGKVGPWKQYPKRMLPWRAVGFHMRDYWSDVGNGLMLEDEARDIPRGAAHARDVTPPESTVTGRSDPLLVGRTEDPAAPESPEEETDLPLQDHEVEDAEWEDAETGDAVDVDPETNEVVPSQEEIDAEREDHE